MQEKKKGKNRGSTIIEVTLIMPMILMIMVLFITMLLSALQQAKAHAGLMITWTEEAYVDEMNSTNERRSGTNPLEQPGILQQDVRVFSEEVTLEMVNGYEITSTEQQKIRITETEKCLRRWQLFGSVDLQ